MADTKNTKSDAAEKRATHAPAKEHADAAEKRAKAAPSKLETTLKEERKGYVERGNKEQIKAIDKRIAALPEE